MYGMINQAILEYFRDQHGAETADEVRARALCEQTQFGSMTQYPDEISYALIGAAAEILGQPADAILEGVGEYWVEFALRSDYADLLRLAGRTLPEMLQNLDHLHAVLGQSFADLNPPSFWCDEITERSLVLNYASDRAGLGPMVPGLVRGLGRMLGYKMTIEPVATESGESMKFAVQFMARMVTVKSRVQRLGAAEDAA